MPDSTYFTAQAERFRVEADEATLDNVRDRCLRAEAAWSSMAHGARLTERARATREAATAAKMGRAEDD